MYDMKKPSWIKEVWQGLTKTDQLITISLGAILISSLLKVWDLYHGFNADLP